MLHHVFATLAAVVIGGAYQFVLHLGVHQEELVALWIEREVLELAATAVQAHQFSFLSEDTGKLIHDTAVYAHVLVLCRLSGKCHVPLGDLVVAEEVVQRVGEATLQCGRRGHARSQGHVAIEGGVESLHVHTQGLHLLHDAIDIACPSSAGAFGIVHLEFHAVFQVNGVKHYRVEPVGAHLGHDALVYRSGKYESPVVVCMLANEINAAGRHVDIARLAVEMFHETASYIFYVHDGFVFCSYYYG